MTEFKTTVSYYFTELILALGNNLETSSRENVNHVICRKSKPVNGRGAMEKKQS